ncbi:MAG: hypothetical protein QXQ64_08065 [Candidatus Bathyarchaeia archaeon]
MNRSEGIVLAGLILAAAAGAFIILNQSAKIAELSKSLEEKSEEILNLRKEMSSLSEQAKKAELVECVYKYNAVVKSYLKVTDFTPETEPSYNGSGGLGVTIKILYHEPNIELQKLDLQLMSGPYKVSQPNLGVKPLIVLAMWDNISYYYTLMTDAYRYEFTIENVSKVWPFYEYGASYNLTYYIETYTGTLYLVYFRGLPEVSFFFNWNQRYAVDLSKIS